MTASLSGPQIDGLEFLDHLGSGGYSDVYLYERRTPRMKVAVKVLKDARLSAAERAQFAAEAEAMAELADHPNIVQVFSTDTTADGRPYLIMKYYPPPNLAKRAAQERFSVPDVLRTGVKIASAVETAHRAGILHRDIKPANILVSQYGEPGLTDFGIAGHATEAEVGDDVGVSIPWSPPEVLGGESNGTARSDVYSLAATLWHLLVGRSPFEVPGGDNGPRALMARVLRGAPSHTGRADVPASLERLLQQAMAKNPTVRPRSALEFGQALQGIEQEQRFSRTELVVEGRPGSAPRTDPRPAAAGDDRTRLRMPVRVAPTAQPAGRAPAPAAPPPPPPKPVDALPVSIAPSSPRGEPPSRDVPDPTVRRPARPTTLPPADAVAPRKRGIKGKYVVLGAAMTLVAALVVGIVLASSGGPNRRADNGLSSGPATDQLVAAPVQPVVSAQYNAATHVLVFTWSYDNPRPGDYFRWISATGNGAPTTIHGAARLEIRTTRPATTCIKVQVVNTDGQLSLYSDKECG